MRVLVPADPRTFLERTEAFLGEREAFHSLLLSVPARLRDQPERFADDEPPVFAVVVDDDERIWAACVRTPPQRLIVAGRVDAPPDDAGAGLETALSRLVEHLFDVDPDVPGVVGPAPVADAVARRLAQRLGRRVQPAMRMRVYELRRVLERGSAPGRARHAVAADTELLLRWLTAFNDEVGLTRTPSASHVQRNVEHRIAAGDALLWEDGGQVVSLASRARPTRSGVTINAVYTPPERRGRGYATACVARLSQQELDRGYAFCTLFADIANDTSNHIYRRIGYRELGEFAEFDIVP